MANGPRIVFMRFVSRDTSKIEHWRQHRARVVGGLPSYLGTYALPEDRSVIAWNLVSANNRTLARSAALYLDLDDAIAAVETLVSRDQPMRTRMITDDLNGHYGWFGSTGDEPVITCARWYLTERDRRSSMELAVVALAAATISSDARLIDPSLTGSR